MAKNAVREIKALIDLLGDESPEIHSLVWNKLIAFGASAGSALKEVAFSDSEGKVRISAQALLEEIRLDVLAKKFERINQAAVFDLEQACFLLAEIEYPGLNPNLYIERIEELTLESEKRIFNIHDHWRQIERINQFLFQEEGFRGNVDSYFDPRNSYLNQVLDRYLGIPISLSTIYLFIARRLDLPVYGVGFPGHFLLRYERDANPIYIDAFNAGKILTSNDCARYLTKSGYQFCDRYLSASGPKEILARMIRNLVLIYNQSNQRRRIDTLDRIFSQFLS